MDRNPNNTSPADVMRAMVAAFHTGDVSRVDEVVDPGYVDHQGLGGTAVKGPDGFRTVVETARAGYRELSVTIEDLIEGHDRVAARIRWRGVRPSGEAADREGLDILRVDRGRAVEHWGARC